jgi:hypothetical protein
MKSDAPKSLQKTKKKKLIVVLGMHRSGTSVLASSLRVMNVDLGSNLMPGIKGVNDKGFWEDMDIYHLNEQMLATLSNAWHYLLPISSSDVVKLNEAGFREQALRVLGEKFTKIDTFGFKDPRLCKLLPFWKQIFSQLDLDVNYIIALRHPLSVAQSLEKRDGFPIYKSLFLWLDHTVSGLEQTKNEQRILVDYDLLMENPEESIYQIAQTFELAIELEKFQEFKNKFLVSSLRHNIFSNKNLENDLKIPEIILEAYEELLKTYLSPKGLQNPIFYTKLLKWKKFIDSQERSWELVNIVSGQYSQALTQLAERDAQLKEKKQTVQNQAKRLQNQSKILQQLSQKLKEKKQTAQNQAKRLQNQSKILQQLSRRLEAREVELAKIHQSKVWRLVAFLRRIRGGQ